MNTQIRIALPDVEVNRTRAEGICRTRLHAVSPSRVLRVTFDHRLGRCPMRPFDQTAHGISARFIKITARNRDAVAHRSAPLFDVVEISCDSIDVDIARRQPIPCLDPGVDVPTPLAVAALELEPTRDPRPDLLVEPKPLPLPPPPPPPPPPLPPPLHYHDYDYNYCDTVGTSLRGWSIMGT